MRKITIKKVYITLIYDYSNMQVSSETPSHYSLTKSKDNYCNLNWYNIINIIEKYLFDGDELFTIILWRKKKTQLCKLKSCTIC